MLERTSRLPGSHSHRVGQSASGEAPASVSEPDRGWDFPLLCVAAFLATSVGRIHQLFPILMPLRPVLVSAGLALGLYLLDTRRSRHPATLVSPITAALLGLLAWTAASVPGALHQGMAFRLLVDHQAKSVILALLIVGTVRGFRDLERLCLVYLGGAVVYASVVLTRFDLGGEHWRLGGLYYYDANDFATFAVTAVPLGIYFLTTRHSGLWRILAVAGVSAIVAAFVWSGSRGGFLALAAALVFLALRYRVVPARWRIVAVVVVTAAVIASASERYWEQIATLANPAGDYNVSGEQGRLAIWQRGLDYMLDHPLFGVGADNFAVAEGTISPLARRQDYGIGVRWAAAHNSLVQVGAELGVPGLLLFLVVMGTALQALSRPPTQPSGPRRDAPRALGQALSASLVGFGVGALFLSLAYAEMLYALVGLAGAFRKIARLDARRTRSPGS